MSKTGAEDDPRAVEAPTASAGSDFPEVSFATLASHRSFH
jgi:hypothetical protein